MTCTEAFDLFLGDRQQNNEKEEKKGRGRVRELLLSEVWPPEAPPRHVRSYRS